MAETSTSPTTDGARAAQAALAPGAFEAAVRTAGDYLSGRRQHYGIAELDDREIDTLGEACALAIRAYQEEAAAPTYQDGVRDALAAAAQEAERATAATPATLAAAIRMMGTAGPLAQDGPVQVENAGYLRDRIIDQLADFTWNPADTDEEVADAVMAEVAPELDERNTRIAELETRLAGSVTIHPDYRAGHACIGGSRVPAHIIAGLVPDTGEEGVADFYPSVTPAGARAAAKFVELYAERDGADAWDVSRMEHEADVAGDRIRELEEELAAANQVGRCGHAAPALMLNGTPVAAPPLCALPASHLGWHRADDGGEWGAVDTDEQPPAATWPSRAARQLADETHPTTDRSAR